jgi:hypothetical protein
MTHRPVSGYTRLGGSYFLARTLDQIRTHARGEPHEAYHEIVRRHFIQRLRRFLMFFDYHEVDEGRAPH